MKKLVKMIKNRKNREKIYVESKFWDEKAKLYQGNAVSMWPNNNLNELYNTEKKFLIDIYFSDLKEKEIIDIGCGTGRMANYFFDKGANVKGIDFSKESIKIAKNTTNKQIEYEVVSIFDFKEKENYDKVFIWGVLAIANTTTKELKESLERIYNSLKKNGEALLLEPIHKGFLHRVLNINLKEFIEIMKEVGFEIIEVKQMHFWPTRVLLSYFNIPMFITKPIYYLGQLMMKIIPNSGDYKLIYVKKSE